jgi:hypothetical protein
MGIFFSCSQRFSPTTSNIRCRLYTVTSTTFLKLQYNNCLTLCLLLWLGEYWFRISHYVYDCNRPLAPILRQSQCSLMYDVYLTCIDDDEQVLHVKQDRKTWNTVQDQNLIFFFWTTNNEQWKSKIIEWKQKSNKLKWKSNNNNKILHDITGTRALCTT